MFYPTYVIFMIIETMCDEYQPIFQRSIFYVDRIAKREIGGGPLSLLIRGLGPLDFLAKGSGGGGGGNNKSRSNVTNWRSWRGQ